MTELAKVPGKRILLVEDDTEARESIKLLLGIDRHTVTEAGDGFEALRLFTGGAFDLVITDYLMPSMNGDQLALNIKNIAPAQPILMITAYLEKLHDSDKPVDVLAKPFGVDELRRAVAGPIQQFNPPETQPDKLPVESLNLSRQGIVDRASTTTKVLHDILKRDTEIYYLRHGGIS